MCCLLTVFLGEKAYCGSSSLWLSSNIAIASTSKHYQSSFQSLNQQPSGNDSSSGNTASSDNENDSYTLNTGFSVGLAYEGDINAFPNLRLSHVPKLGFSKAVIHFPNGVGIFASPTTIESRSLTFSEQVNWNMATTSSPIAFAVGVGYRHIFNYDTFRLGKWGFVEKPNWGEFFYQAQAHFPLHKLNNDNMLQVILSIERSGGYTLPQVRVEADF